MKLFLLIPWFILKEDAIFALAKKNNGSLKYFGSVVQLVRIPVPIEDREGRMPKNEEHKEILRFGSSVG